MQVEELLAQARDAMTVKRVFGDPIEKDGVTVIPVANVMGGAGAGAGEGPAPDRSRRYGHAEGAEPAEGEHAGAVVAPEPGRPMTSGMGGGYGIRATPAGVYVIKDGEVEWEPALDVTRISIMGMFVGVVALLVVRSVLKRRLP